jgi:hypothetical protein
MEPDAGPTFHLAVLEALAVKCSDEKDFARWQSDLNKLYGLETGTNWVTDEALLRFYAQSAQRFKDEGKLSRHIGTGFW